MKQASGRKPRQITSGPSGRPARPAPPPVRKAPASQKLFRWFNTSRLAIVLGVIVLATILTIMFFRLTSPDASATPSPTAVTPQALYLERLPDAGDAAASSPWLLG